MLNRRRIRLLLDIGIACALAGAGAWFVLPVFQALGNDQLESRFQVVMASFRGAAMVAAGQGMADLDMGRFPELGAFYHAQASSFDISLIPEEYRGEPIQDSYSLMHYHLMYAIGLTWRILGVSYWAVHVLCIILFALTAAAVYGLFRLAMGRILAMVATAATVASPALLMSCPSLRDFGKAPFLFTCFLLLGILLTRKHTRRGLLLWSALYGATAGVGYGFRQDLLICVPAALFVLVCFALVDAPRPFRARLLAAALLASVFLVVSFPVMRGVRMDQGSARAQAFTQGVSVVIEDNLDFGFASYDLHYDSSDFYDFAVINAYARRQGDTTPMPGHFSAPHGAAGGRFMREVMGLFPGDMFARGLASIGALPHTHALAGRQTEMVAQSHGPVLRDRAAAYAPLAAHFTRWGLAYGVAALLVLCVKDLRLGVPVSVLCVYFGAYPSLLYEFRHFFHLAFVPYWALGYLISNAGWCLFHMAKRLLKRNSRALDARTIGRKGVLGLAFALAFAFALMFVLHAARAVQYRNVNRLLDDYAKASIVPVDSAWERSEGGWLLCPEALLPGLADTRTLSPFETSGEYLALALSNTGLPVELRVVYTENTLADFSQRLRPRPGLVGESGDYLLFFPVYELAWPGLVDGPESEETGVPCGVFHGVEIPDMYRSAVRGLFRVENGADFSLWPIVAVPESREAFIMHKSGPLDRALSMAWTRLAALWDRSDATTLRRAMGVMRRYPGSIEAEELTLRIPRNQPNSREALKLWGILLRGFPRLYPKAEPHLDGLVVRAAADEAASEAVLQEAEAWDRWSRTRYGLIVYDRGHHEAALALYRATVEDAPEFRFAAENLDAHYERAGDREGRVEEWRRLHAMAPSASLPQLFLGIALRDAGALDEAEACFRSIIEAHPSCRDEAWFHLGAAVSMTGRMDEGSAILREALAASPGRLGLAVMMYGTLGRYYYNRGDAATAADQYRRALQLDPDHSWNRIGLADALAVLDEMDEARQLYETVLTGVPELAYPAFRLDSLLIAGNDAEERIEAWQKLVEMNDSAAIPWLYLGKALEAGGRREAAVEAYGKAWERDTNLIEAKEFMNRLKNEATVDAGS